MVAWIVFSACWKTTPSVTCLENFFKNWSLEWARAIHPSFWGEFGEIFSRLQELAYSRGKVCESVFICKNFSASKNNDGQIDQKKKRYTSLALCACVLCYFSILSGLKPRAGFNPDNPWWNRGYNKLLVTTPKGVEQGTKSFTLSFNSTPNDCCSTRIRVVVILFLDPPVLPEVIDIQVLQTCLFLAKKTA